MGKMTGLLRTLAAAGVIGTVAGSQVARRRWSRASDPTGGGLLDLPPGEQLTVTGPDGTTLAGWIGGPPEGRLVVAVHGWTEDGRVWAPVVRRLVDAGHRVAVYD
ncbi:MAG: hypothetical protein ACRDXE_01770, partial [Acidimicrobiales bacterium]